MLKNSDIELYINKPRGIAHNKTIVIDDNVVITGSYNFTKAAEYNNVENLLIIRSEDINAIYRANFYKCLRYSRGCGGLKYNR